MGPPVNNPNANPATMKIRVTTASSLDGSCGNWLRTTAHAFMIGISKNRAIGWRPTPSGSADSKDDQHHPTGHDEPPQQARDGVGFGYTHACRERTDVQYLLPPGVAYFPVSQGEASRQNEGQSQGSASFWSWGIPKVRGNVRGCTSIGSLNGRCQELTPSRGLPILFSSRPGRGPLAPRKFLPLRKFAHRAFLINV